MRSRVLSRAWSNFEEALIAVLLAAILLMVVAGVVARYVLHESISFTEELTRYLFVWATFLGVAAAAKHHAHLGLNVIVDRLRGTSHTLVVIFATVACIAFFAVLAISGALVVKLQMQTGQTTSALGAPMWWIGLAVPVGASLTVIRFAEALFRSRREEAPAREG